MSIFEQLAAEFPREAISWRAQSLTSNGDKAMALAYIDARDVMDRLDEVCGPSDWQDRYEFHGSRTVCYLSIRIGGEWITKADGAGDSDVEAEKGAISDALKRAAVKWGIGRYLYHLKSPWVPCECSDFNGKKQWKSWTASPWDYVRGQAPKKDPSAPKLISAAEEKASREKASEAMSSLWNELEAISSLRGVQTFWTDNVKTIAAFDDFNRQRFTAKKDELKAKFSRPADDTVADIQDTFPGSRVVAETVREQHYLEAGE